MRLRAASQVRDLRFEHVVATLMQLWVRVAEAAPGRAIRARLDVHGLAVSAQTAMRFVHDGSSLWPMLHRGYGTQCFVLRQSGEGYSMPRSSSAARATSRWSATR